MIQDAIKLGTRVGTQHGDACRAEVTNALKQGRGSQMATDVQNATILVDAVDALINLTAHQRHLFLIADHWYFSCEQELLHFPENPRGTDTCPAHHHAVNAIAVKALLHPLRWGHVSVTDDGNLHARVMLSLAK